MGLLSIVSQQSLWRGFHYYQDHRVISCFQVGDDQYDGQVEGSQTKPYLVHIDLQSVRSSTCSCPYAAGTRIVCKHMIALYFEALPEEAATYTRLFTELQREKEEYEERQRLIWEEKRLEVVRYVESLPLEELQNQMVNMLMNNSDDQDEDDFWDDWEEI